MLRGACCVIGGDFDLNVEFSFYLFIISRILDLIFCCLGLVENRGSSLLLYTCICYDLDALG